MSDELLDVQYEGVALESAIKTYIKEYKKITKFVGERCGYVGNTSNKQRREIWK